MKTPHLPALATVSLLFATLQTAPSAHAQGSLTPPPGFPSPTMKTLDQIEARKPVQAVSGEAPYTITRPGSYYLTGNITVATGSAIIVASDDVSIDLNGFTIRSTLVGSISGGAISPQGNRFRLTVRNGSIVSGTTLASGVAAPDLAGFEYGIGSTALLIQANITEVHISGTKHGIIIEEQGVVTQCTVRNCGFTGIHTDIARDCVAQECYNHGIVARNATNCTGAAKTGFGILCIRNAFNSSGSSVNSHGLWSHGSAQNCFGYSDNATGLVVVGTASFCRAENGVLDTFSLIAGNAIGCSIEGGAASAPLKSLGTP